MSPIPENLLVELRSEMADVRSLLIEALGDFTVYQEGLLRLHEREKKIARFYRVAFITVTIALALFIGFGTAQMVSTRRVVGQTKNLGVQNNLLLEEIDCVVAVAAEVPPKDQPAAYGKCLQPKKGKP
jgi:hypothetical protein